MKKLISVIVSLFICLSIFNIDVCAAITDAESTGNACPQCGSSMYISGSTGDFCTEYGSYILSCSNNRICGYSEHRTIRPSGHNYRSTINKTNGIISYECTRCKDTYTELISEHKCIDFVSVNNISPTCTTPGQTGGKRCIGCKAIVEDQTTTIIPALGHSLGYNDDGKEPTCTEVGYYSSHKCTRSGCNYTVEGEVRPALGHKEVIDKALSPTCTETGLTEGSHCGVCGEVIVKQEVVPATHTESEYWLVTKEPTDTEVGERVKYCVLCDEVLETEIFNNICKHTSVTDKAVTPTCSNFGLTEGRHCSRCNCIIVKQEIVAKSEHCEVPLPDVPATCTEVGYHGGSYCSVCNETIIAPEEISKINHSLIMDKGIDPTCTEPGLTYGHHCSVCNEIITNQVSIPSLGHCKIVIEGKTVTCTQSGLTYGLYCIVCNEVFQEQEVIPATGHGYESEAIKDATCTELGEVKYTCKDCGDTYTEIIPIDEDNHPYKTEVLKEATCTEQGEMKFTCGCGDSYNEIIPLQKHTEVIDKEVPATCTETGLSEGKHCSVCNEVLQAQEILPITPHSKNQSVVIKNSTCSENGETEYTCSCGYTFTEITPKADHKKVIDEAGAPTCTESGLTQGQHCLVCDEVLVAQKGIPATGHTEVIDNAVAPTCTETGLTEGKHCSECGEVLVPQTEIKATGHKTKTIGAKKATYFVKGHTGKEVCKNCGEVISKGKAIPILKLKTPTAKYTGGKKKLTVKYKSVKDATGFQVKYKIGKKTVTKTYKTKQTATKTIKNLKKGTYKVYVRSFIKKGTNKAFSSWSKVKKVKVK